MQVVYMKGQLAYQNCLNVKLITAKPVSSTAFLFVERLIENGFTVVLTNQSENSDTFSIMKSYVNYKTKTGNNIIMFCNYDEVTIFEHETVAEVYAYFKKFWTVSCEYNALKFVGK